MKQEMNENENEHIYIMTWEDHLWPITHFSIDAREFSYRSKALALEHCSNYNQQPDIKTLSEQLVFVWPNHHNCVHPEFASSEGFINTIKSIQ